MFAIPPLESSPIGISLMDVAKAGEAEPHHVFLYHGTLGSETAKKRFFPISLHVKYAIDHTRGTAA